jgi:hypothetical protein
MFYPLDIFKTESDGGVLWRGAAETVVAAKAFVKKLAASSPGEYLILDQHTGERVVVTRDTSTQAAPSTVDPICSYAE